SGSSWVDTVIDAVSAATCGVAIGRGRNDDTVRVYGCNRNGEVWEFTHIHPYVGINEGENNQISSYAGNISLYPNPSVSGIKIAYTLDRKAEVVILVYDIYGKELRRLIAEEQMPGHFEVNWDNRDNSGRRVPSGIYFIKIAIGDTYLTKKIVFCR
ncbi:MAG: FlgD immunoglobulin-like domain containing protein, partial [candidate division WOR-3 bacterium]